MYNNITKYLTFTPAPWQNQFFHSDISQYSHQKAETRECIDGRETSQIYLDLLEPLYRYATLQQV
jgi:hypothetical protein